MTTGPSNKRKQDSMPSFRPPYPRERSSGALMMASLSYQGDNSSDNNVSSYGGSLTYPSRLAVGTRAHMKDVVTPGYKALVANGAIVNTPMSRVEVTLNNKSGTTRLDSTVHNDFAEYTGFYTCAVANYGPCSIAETEVDWTKISSLQNTAAVQALANVAAPEALSLVSLAELPKTVDLIAEQVKRLGAAVRLMKQGKPSKAILRLLGSKRGVAPIPKGKRLAAANDLFLQRWLETRYGWGPLVYDIQGHLAAKLAAKSGDYDLRYRARGRATTAWKTEQEGPHSPTSGGLTEPWTVKTTVNWEATARAWVLYEWEKPELISAHVYGVTQLPLSLWELVPLSFVVDWFVQVGDWLQAITPKVGVRVLAEGSTIAITGKKTRRITGETANAQWTSSGLIGWTDEASIAIKQRSPGLPSFVYPPVQIKLNPKRFMDALALLKGAAGRNARI